MKKKSAKKKAKKKNKSMAELTKGYEKFAKEKEIIENAKEDFSNVLKKAVKKQKAD